MFTSSRLLSGALIFAASIACSSIVNAMETPAKQVIMVDHKTGQVLFKKNHDQQMPTSSMSKVMTMYMVFDALKKGQITLGTEFKVSEKAWKKGGSKMFVEVGNKVKVKDLIRGVIVQSGNDATIVLAEGLAKTEDNFARLMTEKAKEIGMKNSNFMNASGWPDPNHYSTAEDLSILAKRMIEDFPEYYAFYKEKEFEYNDIKQPNRNPLLYRDIGADGLKTGHTEAGGYGLIGTAVKDGRRVVMVVNGLSSEKERASIGSKIIEWGLNGFENKTLKKANEKVASAKVSFGKEESVPLIIKDEIFLSIPKGANDNIKISVHYKSPLKAPIAEGKEVARLKIDIPDMNTFEYPLYTANSVEELGFFSRALANAKLMIFNSL